MATVMEEDVAVVICHGESPPPGGRPTNGTVLAAEAAEVENGQALIQFLDEPNDAKLYVGKEMRGGQFAWKPLKASLQNIPRVDNQVIVFVQASDLVWAAAKSQAKKIRNMYLVKDLEFLWDPNSALLLPNPSFPRHEKEEGIYVGRAAAKAFYKAVGDLTLGQRMIVIGAKGSGKSTVAKAIVGTLLASEQRALYLTSSVIRQKKKLELLYGLFLAFPSALYELTNVVWEEMITWCASQKGPIYLFIDDWEDNTTTEIEEIFDHHILVKISSTNSEARYGYLKTDKPKEKYGEVFRLDGPYTEQELNTWIYNSGLLQKFKEDIEGLYARLQKWTGGMPRLLNVFAEVQGDESKMQEQLDFYEKRLKSFIDEANDQNDLYQRFLMVTSGAKFSERFESTCFYQDQSRVWHILCPFLQRKGESMILDMKRNLAQRLSLENITMWAKAVEFDCRSKRNPVCLGWNVEGLIIGVIKHLGSIFKNQFRTCIEYMRGEEAIALSKKSEGSFEEGILMVPVAFNEEAVDLFYVTFSNGKYVLIAVQISVAKWKAKLAKGSHKKWKDGILERMKPVFKSAGYDQQFVYLMPKSVGQHGDESEADFKRESFRSIHESLKWIDEDFELEELTKVHPPPLQQCNGKTRSEQQCRIWGAGPNFFCRHHKPSI